NNSTGSKKNIYKMQFVKASIGRFSIQLGTKKWATNCKKVNCHKQQKPLKSGFFQAEAIFFNAFIATSLP
ncbi:MAG: hypothetical protein PHD82_12720, partial [Candidatus Riflebacteria bacterium]|nr:hypothetical protein [Candidatus Riflebacteria bacterium]